MQGNSKIKQNQEVQKNVKMFKKCRLEKNRNFCSRCCFWYSRYYTNVTAAVLRAKECVMQTVTKVQENAGDIYEEAKQINEERAAKEAVYDDEDLKEVEDEVEAEAEEAEAETEETAAEETTEETAE